MKIKRFTVVFMVLILIRTVEVHAAPIISAATRGDGHTVLNITKTFNNACQSGWGDPIFSDNSITFQSMAYPAVVCPFPGQVVGSHQYDLGVMTAGTYTVREGDATGITLYSFNAPQLTSPSSPPATPLGGAAASGFIAAAIGLYGMYSTKRRSRSE